MANKKILGVMPVITPVFEAALVGCKTDAVCNNDGGRDITAAEVVL